MKKALCFIILWGVWYNTSGQGLHIDSTRFITGNKSGTDIEYAIPTQDKGIFFVGFESRNPGGIIPYFPTDTGLENVMIGKIDSNRQISWIRVYGGSRDEAAVSACQTPDGGYAVLAQTESSNGNVTGFKGTDDIWLLRTDQTGNLLWAKCYGSTQSDVPGSIANTPDHGLIFFGTTNGSDGDVPLHYGGMFSLDWIVIKTDSAGNVQWSKTLGGTNYEVENGSILSVDSSYYLISSSDSKNHDCTDTAWHPGAYTNYDYHVLKLNDTGKVLWDSSYGGSGVDEVNYAMYDSRDSTIVMTGITESSNYMVTGFHGFQDMWIVKVKKNGAMVWQKALGDINEDYGTGICATATGGYLVNGWTHPGTGGGDCWLFALDNAGNEVENRLYGGSGYDISTAIVPYLNGYAALGNSGSLVFTEGATYGNFCGYGPFVSYIDSVTVGVKDMPLLVNELRVEPNPANGTVGVHFKAGQQGKITLLNSTGQVMYRKAVVTGSMEIDISGWPAGMYIVVWNDADGNVARTILIKE